MAQLDEARPQGFRELVSDVAERVSTTPFGKKLRLLVLPGGMELEEDEVLVQRVAADGRSASLVPVKVAELTVDDDVFEARVLNPSDEEFARYVNDPRAASCLIRYPDGKHAQHIYN